AHFVLAARRAVLEVLLVARVVDRRIASETLEKVQADHHERHDDQQQEDEKSPSPPASLLIAVFSHPLLPLTVEPRRPRGTAIGLCFGCPESGACRTGCAGTSADSSGRHARR